ncbi:MAG: hypothetical protein ACRC9Q_08305 [Bacteroidales bacterium]
MFINVTNYPFRDWEEAQISAAALYGEVEDFSFPKVGAALSSSEVAEMAREMAERIAARLWVKNDNKNGVLIMGESSFAYALIQECQHRRINALCATYHIELFEDEELIQRFVKFREYSRRIALEEDE